MEGIMSFQVDAPGDVSTFGEYRTKKEVSNKDRLEVHRIVINMQ